MTITLRQARRWEAQACFGRACPRHHGARKGLFVENTAAAVKAFIRQEFMEGRPDQALEDDTDLLEREIIDSLGIFLLLGHIKEEFGIEIEPEDVTLDNFKDISAITTLIESRRSPAA